MKDKKTGTLDDLIAVAAKNPTDGVVAAIISSSGAGYSQLSPGEPAKCIANDGHDGGENCETCPHYLECFPVEIEDEFSRLCATAEAEMKKTTEQINRKLVYACTKRINAIARAELLKYSSTSGVPEK